MLGADGKTNGIRLYTLIFQLLFGKLAVGRGCRMDYQAFDIASKSGIHYYAEPREEVVPYFLLKQLKEGFLDGVTGVYKTPAGYFVDESEVEAFDRRFPPKVKLKLPGQLV